MESQVQTSSILTDTVEVQTEKAQVCHAEVQALVEGVETQC